LLPVAILRKSLPADALHCPEFPAARQSIAKFPDTRPAAFHAPDRSGGAGVAQEWLVPVPATGNTCRRVDQIAHPDLQGDKIRHRRAQPSPPLSRIPNRWPADVLLLQPGLASF